MRNRLHTGGLRLLLVAGISTVVVGTLTACADVDWRDQPEQDALTRDASARPVAAWGYPESGTCPGDDR